MREPAAVAVVGAGIRGQQYARLAVAGGHGRVVAVAEPVPARRELMAREYGLPPEAVLDDWRALADRGRLGYLDADGTTIRVCDFVTGGEQRVDLSAAARAIPA